MRLLAIECSSPVGSVTISQRDQVLASKTWSFRASHQIVAPQIGTGGSTQHSEFLLPAVEACLKDASLTLKQIDLFATSVGPGRFTGIRVAINCIKTFCFSLKRPARCFGSLHVLAQQAAPIGVPVVVLINAQKNMAFFQKFESHDGVMLPTCEPSCLDLSQIEPLITGPTLCLGDAYELYKNYLPTQLQANLIRRKDLDDYPAALHLAQLVFSTKTSGQLIDWKSINPLYVRASEAEEKLKAGGLQEVTSPNLKN